jgi:flagellar protein FliS
MNAHHPIKAYTRASHTTAKTRQIVMLYDGAIRFLQQAKEAMQAKAIEQRYLKLTKASEVVMGLQSCLDFEAGADAARILYDFYSSIDMRIMNLHRSNDAEACGKLIDELREMRDVWDKIDRGNGAATPAAAKDEADTVVPQAVTVSA